LRRPFKTKRVELFERPDERFLREVLCERIVSGQPVGQAVDAIDMGVV
jgi:hypothetical protein